MRENSHLEQARDKTHASQRSPRLPAHDTRRRPWYARSMLRVLAQLCMARPRVVLALAAGLFALAGVLAWDVFPQLKTGGFDDPTSEASRATHVLHDDLGTGAADLVVAHARALGW